MLGKRGVSPVIGVILLVAVTVILSATVFQFATSIHQEKTKPLTTDSGVAGSTVSISQEKVMFRSVSGSGMKSKHLQFTVTVNGSSVTVSDINFTTGAFNATGDTEILSGSTVAGSAIGSGEDQTLSPGETISLPLNSSRVDDSTIEFVATDLNRESVILTDSVSSPTSTKVSSSAPWWDSDWSKRRPISISNPTSNNLSNYQVELAVSHDSDMKSSFDDLRFVTEEGFVLNHWIDRRYTTSGGSARVWVNVTSIPSDGATIYMYYNNSSATDVSTGDGTFVFYDDFESYSTNFTEKWKVVTGSFSRGDHDGDGDYELLSKSSNNDLRAKDASTGSPLVMNDTYAEMDTSDAGGGWNWINIRIVSKADCCTGNWVMGAVQDSDNTGAFETLHIRDVDAGVYQNTTFSPENGVVRLSTQAVGNKTKSSVDSDQDGVYEAEVSGTDSTVESGQIGLSDMDDNVWMDNFFVAKRSAGSLSTAIGSEESK